MSGASLCSERFESRYRLESDPWAYETSDYEREKYERTLHEVPAGTGRALELGCSIGVFTEMLAMRCREVVGIDFSAAAVERARERTLHRRGVTVERRDIRTGLPSGPFDVIVCSEVLYYLSADDARACLERIHAALAPGGRLLSANWRGADPDAPLDADAVEELIAAPGDFERVVAERHPGYLLGVWERGS